MNRPLAIGIARFLVLAMPVILLSACAGGGAARSLAPAASATALNANASKPPVRPPVATPLANPPAEASGDGTTATIKTKLGDITFELFTKSSPVAAENFINLAQAGFYDGVVFHRLVPGFVIQGGDPDGNGSGGPGYTIDDDPVVGTYARGIVAMARTPRPHSQGSQFFIVLDDQARRALDSARTYAIFGRVTSGMDVVDKIATMPNSGEPSNSAIDPVPMTSVTVKRP